MSVRKILAVVAIVSAVALPVGVKAIWGEEHKLVEVAPVALQPIHSTVLASGSLVYGNQVQLTSELIGKVDAVLVKEGQHVQAGQILLRLDDHSVQAEVAQQQSAVRIQRIGIDNQQLVVANQERQYQRKRELHAHRMIADAQLDDARFALELAQIQLRNSQEALRQSEALLRQTLERSGKTVIRAPISGTVTAVDIRGGETAVPNQIGVNGSSLLTIANTDSIKAEINVDEADVASVREGQLVTIYTSAYPNQPLHGEVKAVAMSPKRNDKAAFPSGAAPPMSYPVTITVRPVGEVLLRPGMSCRVEIETDNTMRRLAVPLHAVITDSKSGADAERASHVFVLSGQFAVKRNVQTGRSDDEHLEVVAGLQAGERLVVGPYRTLHQLREGERVG
ncbi:MAG: efflux RND transporter periplasmic adaptor subunit, partial [Burkholderiaceae bacterium]|nr:efflux RND transporter periplasmic adaptor subunit [Burkholderiaceae bacterium]